MLLDAWCALLARNCVQAFSAVQASIVHLQGVPLSKRFALVPLGPPLLSYSSTAKVGGIMGQGSRAF